MKAHLRYLVLCVAMLCVSAATRAQLSGSYTVPSTTHPTLKAIIDSLNLRGVSGAVTVNFTPSTNELAPAGGYRLGSAVLNASLNSSRPLIINGNGNLITANTGTGTGVITSSGTASGSTTDGIFWIMGADYVTINNLNLTDAAANTTTTTQMEYGYVLCKLQTTAPYDGCQNDAINGCVVNLTKTRADASCILAAHIAAGSVTILSTTSAVASSTNSYNKFSANSLNNTSRGVYLVGITLNVGVYDKANVIGGNSPALGNTITVGGTTNTVYGIQTYYDSVITINNNNLSINSTQGNAAVYMIYMQTGKGDLTVTNNYMNIANANMTTAYTYCYYNSGAHSDASNGINSATTHEISGNTITGNQLASTTAYLYGLYESSAYCRTLNMNNNVITDIDYGNNTNYLYLFYGYPTYTPYFNVIGNSIYKIRHTATSGYIYGYYLYDGGAPFGRMTVENNTQRRITSGYYMYNHYIMGSTTTAPTGYTGQVMKVRNNVLDSVDGSNASTCYSLNYMGYYGQDSSEVSYNTCKNFQGSLNGTTYLYWYTYGYYGPNLFKVVGNKIDSVRGNNLNGNIYMGYYATLADSNIISNVTGGINGGTSGSWTTFLGYYGNSPEIRNNRIRDIYFTGTSFYIYMAYYGSNNKAHHNAFTNIRLAGPGTAMYDYFGYQNNAELYNNRLDSIFNSGSGTFYPWYSYPNGDKLNIHDNVITNLFTTSNTLTFYPFYLYSYLNTPIYFYNNTVSKINVPATYASTNSAAVWCYPASSGTTPYTVYNNTININPGVTGAASNYGFTGILFGSSAGTAALDLRNNIINVNVTPTTGGFTTALRNYSGTTGTSPLNFLGTSDGNIFHAPNTTNSWLYGEGTSAGGMVNTYNLTNDPNFNTPCGLFKTFMGHDKSSFTENNLVAAGLPGTFVPTGTSYAEKGGVPTTTPQVQQDYAGTIRGSVVDMGALEFNGTALDNAPPIISYTPVPVKSYCVTTPTIVATITDVTGVNNTPGTAPRLYYKKSTDANTIGANNSSVSGWKYVEASAIAGSLYTFTFDYSLLTSTVTAGDSITYFIIAQDVTTNTNTNATIAAFTLCPTTVALTSSNTPIKTAPKPNGFIVLPTPVFRADAFPAAVCQSGSAVISIVPTPVGATVQWQVATLTGAFANIPGGTGNSINTGTLTTSMRYRVIVYCGTNVLTTSPIDTFIVANPSIISTTGASRCGYGSLTLSVTTPLFTSANWYTTATGGKPFFSGTSYTTPNISSSVTYYVSGNVANASTEVVTKAPAVAYSYTMYNYGLEFIFANPTTNFYSTKVYPQGSGSMSVELVDISTGNTIRTAGPFTISGAGGISTPTVLNLNWSNIPAGDYSLQVANGYSSTLYLNYEYQYPTFAWPYVSPSGGVKIVGPTQGGVVYPYAYYYWFFYDNVVSGNCEGATRVPVTATITPAPPITASSPQSPGICLGSSATLNVTSPNVYYNYAWTPGGSTATSLTVSPTSSTMYYVIASDPYTLCVNIDSVNMFVNPVPNPPVISPTNPTICQGSSVILTGTAPPGPTATAYLGTGTATNCNTCYPTPWGAFYTGNHTQYMITASELTALGVKPGNITSMSFNQSSGYTGGSMMNFKLSMTTTTATTMTTMVSTGMTTVYAANPSGYSPPTTAGWVTYPFTTPIYWDGSKSLIVDVQHMNCTTCPATPCVSYTTNGSAYYTPTTYTSTLYAYADGDCSVATYTPTYLYTSTNRANMMFTYQKPTALNWLNVTGLYKNAGLTTPVTLTDTTVSPWASPTVTTVYRAISNAQGCKSSPSLPDTVFVNPAPDVTIAPAGTNTICANASVTLCIPSGSNQTYQWYLNNVAIAGAISNCYTATGAGTYKVTATNVLTGCAATSINSVVVVNPVPTITITTSGPTTFCNGGNVLITAASPTGVIYQWQRNGSNIPGATGTTYTATTSGTYTVVVTNALSCSSTSTATVVTNNATPTTVVPQGSLTFCTGGSVTLQGPTTAGLTYQWFMNAAAIPAATASSYTASIAGNYYLRVSDPVTGCSDTSYHFQVVVGTPPSATITPSPTASTCAGNTVLLTTNQAPGLSYDWMLNGVSTGGTASTYAAGVGGNYTVKVSITATPSCNATTTTPTVVTVNPLPTATATAAGATTFCQGDSVILNANTGTGLAYQWNLNGNPVPLGGTTSSYVARAGGNYTVSVTNTATGCVKTSTAVAVTVNPAPPAVIQASGPITFCQGSSVVLTSSITTGYTLQWNNYGAPMAGQTGSNITVSTTGLYTVTAINTSTGCKATSAVTSVQVNALPDPSTMPTGNTPICQNTTVTIGVTTIDTNMTYQWKVNGVNINGATSNTFTTGTAGTYTVVVTNKVTNCQATSAQIVVTVTTPPVALATVPGKTTICQDDSTKLKANIGTGLSYQWKLNGNNILGANDTIYYAKLPGNYTVAVSNGANCTTVSNSVTITVNPRPAAYITYNTPLEFCEGSAVVLVANAGAGLTYQWLMNGTPLGNTGGFNISAVTGIYALQVTNNFNCATVSDPLNVVVHATPVPSITRSGNSLSTTTAYLNYQWFFNNNAIGGATSGSYSFNENGAYKVRVVDQYGCEGFSNQYFVNNVGITNPALGNSIKVYPNPTTGLLNIDAKVRVKVALRDVTGKALIEATDVKSIDMGDVANGVYLLYISDLEGHLLRAEKVTKANQ